MTIEIVNAPFRAKRRTGTARPRFAPPPGPKDDTEISTVNNGEHFNVYVSIALMEVADTWERGASVKYEKTDGKWTALLLSKSRYGYSLRKGKTQRPHFCVPTPAPANTLMMIPVETSIDGDTIRVSLPPECFPEVDTPNGEVSHD